MNGKKLFQNLIKSACKAAPVKVGVLAELLDHLPGGDWLWGSKIDQAYS